MSRLRSLCYHAGQILYYFVAFSGILLAFVEYHKSTHSYKLNFSFHVLKSFSFDISFRMFTMECSYFTKFPCIHWLFKTVFTLKLCPGSHHASDQWRHQTQVDSCHWMVERWNGEGKNSNSEAYHCIFLHRLIWSRFPIWFIEYDSWGFWLLRWIVSSRCFFFYSP